MTLNKPLNKAFDFDVKDIYGKTVKLSSTFKGKAVILCFFRDTERPSRNSRIFELTRFCEEWRDAGVEIVVVFNEASTKLKRYFEKRPRPFRVIGDPKLHLYREYGVQRVIGKDLVTKNKSTGWLYRLFKGCWAWLSPVGREMPAEFLINPDGFVKYSWQGRSESDHMPLDQLETFVMSIRVAMRKRKLAL